MTKTYSIRLATLADVAALQKLGSETFAETFGHLYKREDLEAFLAKSHSSEAYERVVSNEGAKVYIADDTSGNAIGYVSATPCGLPVPGGSQNGGEIQRFYLYKDWQGKGLGGQLFDLAMTFLKSRYDRVFLSVYHENFGAIRFYERQGFVKIHQYNYMVGNQADPEFIMELQP